MGAQTRSRSLPEPALKDDDFSSLRCFCLFIGYPRSGSSVVGAYLDAHPAILISHELDALAWFGRNWRDQRASALFQRIARLSSRQARRGRREGRYDYAVPDAWQGTCTELRVIGDKQAGWTAIHLGNTPELLGQFRQWVGLPLRFIHIVRNPFDNIATIARKDMQVPGAHTMNDRLALATAYYFDFCSKGVVSVRRKVREEEWLTVYHEDFVARPRAALSRLAGFLGVEPGSGWLDSCAARVLAAPRRPMLGLQWPTGSLAAVEEKMRSLGFLKRYCR